VFDRNFDTNGDYQSPNPILKQYIDKAKPFPYGEDQVQLLINFANEASKVIAGVGTMIVGMIREQQLLVQEMEQDGCEDDAQKVRALGSRMVRMNDDLKVLCLSVNCMAASLIETAKKAEATD
jgi:hypothetical protein